MSANAVPWVTRAVVLVSLASGLAACASATSPTSPAAPATSSPRASPTHGSTGHEGAEAPTDPSVSLPTYGYYATLQDPAIRAAPFTLTDQHGEPYRFDPARDDAAITLLYFGYTNCPDLCPSELATVATALRNVPDAVADQVRMVFVSVDPARDGVARMAEYMPLFDPTFVGLTGDDAVIRRAQVSHGLEPAERVGEGEDYAMRHAAEVLAFTDDGRVHLVFPFGMTVLQWEHDLWKLIQTGWREPR
ncbi:MAG TPA: SCO family protein [Actinomycetota bacterium]